MLVSVPLRGLWFLIWYQDLYIASIEDGFRPLTGFMVLNRKAKMIVDGESTILVSVPLRGLWFLISDPKDKINRRIVECRPLTGFMVLNLPYENPGVKDITVPSPYGVYGS